MISSCVPARLHGPADFSAASGRERGARLAPQSSLVNHGTVTNVYGNCRENPERVRRIVKFCVCRRETFARRNMMGAGARHEARRRK
ncbi:hypothetical protein DM77_3524 [Burkholderia mallei]|nr:hypothetical protein DM77_3524 [Burkholderia mallei]